MSNSYVLLKDGPYHGMKRNVRRLPTFTFTAKGMTGFYHQSGKWIAVTSPK